MTGLEFLFLGALIALPLAGLPVLLHLLFRRKAPVVHFSTLRFIKSSIQRTAARKRVQRWLLLACRVALLLLFILAVAQPACKRPAGLSGGGGKSVAAAVVVDTSYSMELQDQRGTLLGRANDAVTDLLRRADAAREGSETDDLLGRQLRNARFAVFTSTPRSGGKPEQLRTAADLLSSWVPLKPTPSPVSLLNRTAAAVGMLQGQQVDERWLIVVSDFQAREFPQSLPEFKAGRTILLDLSPGEARSAGVTKVGIEPRQAIPGLVREAVADVAGRPQDKRAVTVSVTTVDGRVLDERPAQVAMMDSAGRSRVRVPIRLPAERWTLLKASLQSDDALAWDNTRAELIEVPPRQAVTVLDAPNPATALPAAQRVARLALDWSEGRVASWPLKVNATPELASGTAVAVLVAGEWPDAGRAAKLRDFVRGGGTLIWFLRPGLEATWKDLPSDGRKDALRELLPAEPVAVETGASSDFNTVGVAAPDDPVLEGLTDERFELRRIVVRRFVPMLGNDQQAATLLNTSPKTPTARSRPRGLLYREPLGAGTVFTWTTAPDRQFGNLATHPLFLPLVVGMSLRPASRGDAQNVELGQPVFVAGSKYDAIDRLRVQGPGGEVVEVAPVSEKGVRKFVYGSADQPGVYAWKRAEADEVLALSNVQLPAAEAELAYKRPHTLAVPGPAVTIVRSLDDVQREFEGMNASHPWWPPLVAGVMLLLCAEALMGSLSGLWRAPRVGGGSGARPMASMVS